MKSAENLFREYLHATGRKFTPERSAVLREVMKIHDHFEVDDIVGRFQKGKSGVSRASIYRTLPLLVDSGVVRKTPCDAMTARYEHVYGHEHHDHMVCVKCGKVIEFKKDGIEKLQIEAAKENDFDMVGHRLVISGFCSKCR